VSTTMTEDQFLMLQEAVQWAATDEDLRWAGRESDTVKWDQNTWGRGVAQRGLIHVGGHSFRPVKMSCSSACCLAGNGALLAGAQMVQWTHLGHAGEETNVDYCVTPDGRLENIATYAQEVFGLDSAEAEHLFHSGNEIHTLIEYATMFAARAGFTLVVHRKERDA